MARKPSRSANGTGAMEKTSTGWRLRCSIRLENGTTIRKSFSAKTQAQCRKAKDAFIESMNNPKPKALPTLSEWGNQWLETKKDAVVWGTYHNYEMYFRLHIMPVLGGNRIDQIIPIQLEMFMRTKKYLSWSAQRAIHIELSQMFKAAVTNQLIAFNPMASVMSPKKPQEKTKVYTVEQINNLIAHADEDPFGYRIVFLLSSGCRFEELAALKWTDIEGGETLHIQRVLVRTSPGHWDIAERTKSGKDRYISLSPTMLSLLPRVPHTSDFIFPDDNGKPMDYDRFYRRFKKYLRDCCVPYQGIHTCRHSYGTYALRGAGNLRSVQEALGHSSSRVTERYTHPDLSDQKKLAESLPY